MLTFAKFWSVLQMRPAVIKPQGMKGMKENTNTRTGEELLQVVLQAVRGLLGE
jgi:hypothetical protein